MGMNPNVASGLITAGGGILSSVIGNWFNSNLLAKQMNFARQERQYAQDFQDQQRIAQNQWSEDMYLKHQSPQAMAQAYIEAGLNPRLAAEGNAGSAMGATSGSSGAGVQAALPSAPYMQIGSISSAFQDIASVIKTIGEAKKVGLDSKVLESTLDDVIKQFKNSTILSDLNVDISKAYSKQEAYWKLVGLQKAVDKQDVDIKEVRERLNGLVQDNIIKKYEADNWLESWINQQNKLRSETDVNYAEADLKSAQTMLTELEQETEKTKPELNRTLASLNRVMAKNQSLSYAIRKATSVEEVKSIRTKNKYLIDQIEAELKSLNAQAELAIRNHDYSTWDKINGSIGAIGGLGMLALVGKGLFTKAAPILAAPAPPGFSPTSGYDKNYGYSSEIWY